MKVTLEDAPIFSSSTNAVEALLVMFNLQANLEPHNCHKNHKMAKSTIRD